MGRGAAVLVQYRVRNIAQVVSRRVAEDQALQDRWHEQADSAARVFKDREQLFVDESQNAQDHFRHGMPHTSRFVVTARASASSSGRSDAPP